MDLETAKEFLTGCVRHELRDHAFGDTEVTWTYEDQEVGGGYFGGKASVWLDTEMTGHVAFEGDEARQLRECGNLAKVSRNDETGPDVYNEGVVMPGLTKEGVLDELTKPNSPTNEEHQR